LRPEEVVGVVDDVLKLRLRQGVDAGVQGQDRDKGEGGEEHVALSVAPARANVAFYAGKTSAPFFAQHQIWGGEDERKTSVFAQEHFLP